ncbi:protein of unknown function [Cyanobium sp. NIES-981]|nr:protein of unknown function [Cyanobium sp. NIES-981]
MEFSLADRMVTPASDGLLIQGSAD